MHPSAYDFASTALAASEVAGRTVVEAGSMDVNGSVRPAVEAHGPDEYLATDMRPGPGVDIPCPAEDLPVLLGEDSADVVISTEMLEHAADWQAAMRGMITVLAPGGILVLTTRSPGFPLHGYPEDHWRFPVEVMAQIIKGAGLDPERVEPDPGEGHPGVFVRARKPAGWKWPDGVGQVWDAVEVTRP